MVDFDLNLSDFRASEIKDTLGNISSMAKEERAAALEALNAKIGYDSGGPFNVDADGDITLNGNKVDLETLDRDTLNSELSSGIESQEQLDSITSRMNDPGRLNPTPEQVQVAEEKAVENNQSENLEKTFNSDGVPSTDAEKESAYTSLKNKLKNTNPSFWSKLLKYTIIGAMSYASLSAIATAQSGCFASFGSLEPQKIYSGSDNTDCVFLQNGTFNNAPQAVYTGCQAACGKLIANSSAPPQGTTDFSKFSNTSCNCQVNGTFQNPNVTLAYKKVSPFDVFGNIINAVGGFISTLANGALQLVNGLENLIEDLPKILMWVGIAAAIVAVLVGIGFLAKKLSDKKKRKQLSGGGGKKHFKHWRHQMKQIQKRTPLSHLNASNVFY